MKTSNTNYGGRAFRIAAGTLVIFFVFATGTCAFSNSGGGSWSYYRDITINNTGAGVI